MENNPKDPFISKVKENIKSQEKNINTNTSISNIPLINKNVNEILNDKELSKKIGRMETILNYYEAKLKNEFNERKILEERIETLTTDVYHIKDNLDNLTKLFTENFTKIKNNIMENVETKNNSMNKIIIESSKRINTIEDILLNNNNNNPNTNEILNPQRSSQNIENNVLNKSMNNSVLISTQRDSSFMKQNYIIMQNNKCEVLSKKINKIEKAIFKKGTYLGREEEINMGITKINHLEKKFEIFLENFNKDINIIKNNIKHNMDNVDNLSSGHNILNEKFDNLYRTFNDTNINFNKFNYQTTLTLYETQKKLEEYTDYFKNAKNDIQKMANDINEDNSILKQIFNDKFNDYEKDLKELKNTIDLENNEYKFKIEEKQDKFINLIKDEKDEYLKEAKKIQSNILEKCEIIQNENNKLNNDVNEMKNSFFHNLNEMEQYFNKKYQQIYRTINVQEK